jgi:hypothetical protein
MLSNINTAQLDRNLTANSALPRLAESSTRLVANPIPKSTASSASSTDISASDFNVNRDPTRQSIEFHVSHVAANDRFDIGSQADFYAKISFDNGNRIFTSNPVANRDVVPNLATGTYKVPLTQKEVKIRLQIFDEDVFWDDEADINPVLGKKYLDITLNTETGDVNIPAVTSWNIDRTTNPVIVSGVRANDSQKDGPRATVGIKITRTLE